VQSAVECQVTQAGSERNPSWRGCRSSFVLALILLLLAFLPRVSGISVAPMQTDEIHWTLRAELLHNRVKRLSKNFSTHLGHPGVFPALVLSSGQVAAHKLHKVVERVTGSRGKVSTLVGARLGNAAFSSLLPCIVFLFLLNWTGKGEAFCTGVLLALGPRAIDLSQIAHIDTIFSVVVTLTVMTYLTALRRHNLGLKLVAGALFGLCLLSKPTCLALIPAFMLAKVILRMRWPETFTEGPLAWSDVWVVCSALLVFVLSYTRMWHHHKPYPQWEGIDRTVPEYLFSIGSALSDGVLGIALITVLLLSIIHLVHAFRSGRSLSWVEQTLALLGFLATCWAVMPQAFENLALYFMRVFALTSVQHVSFRGVAPPIPGGYLTLASVDLPPLVLISVFLMPLLFIPAIRRTLSSSEQQLWVMASLVSITWILFLSTSSKQAWRYALPVAPQIYIIACLALCALGRFMKHPKVPLVLLLLGQVKAVYRAYPHWDLYQSPFAPPPQIAAQLGIFHPRTGKLEALRYLVDEAKRREQKVYVTVFGDGKLLSREISRWFGDDAHLVSFGYYREEKAQFVLVQGTSFVNDVVYQRYLSLDPSFVSRVKDVPVATIWAVQPIAR
jgi:Dolichyl-phosphate-mannose-protein mannosyltransferase